MSKVVGVISDAEKNDIEDLFEKKIALENLIKIIDSSNDELYQKLLNDYGRTSRLFNNWWDTMKLKYDWEGSSWSVIFESNEIVLS